MKKSNSKYKISDNLYRCECGKEFNNYQSLNGHLCHCQIHCDKLNKPRNDGHKGTFYWENKTSEEINQIHQKQIETLKQNIKNGKTIIKGHPCSEELKNHLRELRSQQLKDKNMRLNYSKKACEYINKLNEQNNWNLQHAENGGEVLCLGYWLDGYDKDLNIVFEYDEPAHYIDKENNILRDYDIKRQQRIINKLNCEFWRYNEYLDLLYKV